jgi:hypothetical protein
LETPQAFKERHKIFFRAAHQGVELILGEHANAQCASLLELAPRLLARDGLAWLVAKGKLNAAQRMAGERYRGHYELIHSGGLKSCIADAIGGGDPSAAIAAARRHLDKARRHGLASDNTLIWLCDEVAGKGTTLRELAAGDQKRSEALEAELLVALRFLARHYGFAS